MAGLVAMIAVSLIWSAVGFQAWVDVLRRDNEAEMIFRAEDIVRAIQRYRRDHGGQGPRKLSELMEPSPRRSYYIRREYDDPLVPDGKWGLLYMGPGGSIIDPSVEPEDGGLGLGLDSGSSSDQSSDEGSNLTAGQPTTAGQLGGVGNPAGSGGDEGTGLPIAGVKTLCKEKPFRVYKEESEYAKWLFTYLDLTGGGGGRGKGKGKGKGGIGTPTPMGQGGNQGVNQGGASGNQRNP
jgi:hypothetical protein